MAKKVTSVIVILSLSLSIFFGGLGLSLHFAKADTINNSGEFSIVDFWDALDEFSFVPSGVKTDLYNFVNPKVTDNDNSSYLVFICHDSGTDNWALTVFQADYYYWWYGYDKTQLSTNGNQIPWLRMSVLGYFNTNGTTYTVSYYGTVSNETRYACYAFNFSTLRGVDYEFAVPGVGNENVSGRLNWISRTITAGNTGVTATKNLYSSPRVFLYDILVFWLGSRRYITIKDQSIIRQLNGGGLMEYVWAIESPFDDQGDFDLLSFQYNDLVLLQYSGVESQLSNVSPNGVYAVDITDLTWSTIQDSVIYDFVNPSSPVLIGMASNVPYILEEAAPKPGTNGTPDDYTNSWSTFITYINNYDNMQIIPDNLVDTIFGVNGFKLYPVDVSLPSSTIPGNNAFTPGIHTYKYHFASLPADLGLNFELMDVCIIPQNSIGEYNLVYFYDDLLSPYSIYVDAVDYKSILEQFDLIIVVDDDFTAFEQHQWWQDVLNTMTFNIWDFSEYLAVSGSSSQGISYSVDLLPGNVEHGFCIVTKRAIQRQQLYLFNDGITKSYKLMSDFVEKHGLWENSFFQWSQSIFYELQTIGGKTNDIYNLLVGLNLGDVLDNISRQLERIADNTSEEDPGYWFLSLWNFVSRFSVSDLDFANWVDDYDDFESQIPMPNEDVTPIPIPTITSEVG